MYCFTQQNLFYYRGFEFEVEINYDYHDCGKLNDEPQYADVDLGHFYNPRNGKPISKRLQNAIVAEYGLGLIEDIIQKH
jgi:hypothetical protein